MRSLPVIGRVSQSITNRNNMNSLKNRLYAVIQEHHDDSHKLIEQMTEGLLNHELELDGRFEMLSIVQMTCLAVSAKSGTISTVYFLEQVNELADNMWKHHCKLVGIMYN